VISIHHVEIENYRSIESVEFDPTRLCALVGPNNAGKSNILSALELLLGHRYPTEGSLNEEDYYLFRQDVMPRIAATIGYDDEGGYPAEVRFEFGPSGQELKLRAWGEGYDGRYPRKEFRERFSLIRLGMDRGARQQQPSSRWTLLGRLLLEINDRFRASPERMAEFTDAMTSLRDDVLGAAEGFPELRAILREESARQLQRTVADVLVDFALHDPWHFYRTLQLVVTEYDLQVRAENAGMGLQSSLAIALLRAYARVARANRAIIAIEEPELYLHPLAARQFYELMRELTDDNAPGGPLQILYTTHSGLMIDFENLPEIALVRRARNAGEWTTSVSQARWGPMLEALAASGVEGASVDSLKSRLRATFDRSRTEGVFASVVVLVEGPSEELSLPIYARALGIDLDALNIAVVSAGGKTTIPTMQRAFHQLGIPTFALFDADLDKTEREARPQINTMIANQAGSDDLDFSTNVLEERCASWPTDYEDMLAAEVSDYGDLLRTAREELATDGKGVLHQWCAVALADRGEIPSPVRAVLEAISALSPLA
jgi:putative ATP-dependent endonuclease of the OLD family